MLARVPARCTHAFAFLLAWLVAPASHAILIEYEALDLANTTPGADLWQFNYYVSEHDFRTDQGFTVWFDLGAYDNLVPLSASPDWNTPRCSSEVCRFLRPNVDCLSKSCNACRYDSSYWALRSFAVDLAFAA